MSVNSSCRHARIPASEFSRTHEDGVMKPITPDAPMRSEAHRSAILYELFGFRTDP